MSARRAGIAPSTLAPPCDAGAAASRAAPSPDASSEVPRAWLAVASAEHVRRGRAGGFMQVCHGRPGPLARVRPGDHVVYYSPTTTFGGCDALRAFTALGVVLPGAAYQAGGGADPGGGFRPFRRDVAWLPAEEAPVRPLVGALALTAGPHWGYALRRGLLPLAAADFRQIARAMRVALPG